MNLYDQTRFDLRHLVLRGWQGEVLERDRDWVIEQAQFYYDHEPDLDTETRHRIKVTWLEQRLHGYNTLGFKYTPATPPKVKV